MRAQLFIVLVLAAVAGSLTLPGQKDYEHFTHRSHLGIIKVPGTNATRELRCDYCHERSRALSRIVPTTSRNERLKLEFPAHRACFDCHVEQFTSQPLRTCTICHESNQSMSSRPPQRDFPHRYDFNAFFDLKQHQAHSTYQFADNQKLECNFCHNPTSRGAARLIADHSQCYACHTPSSGVEKAAQKSGCVVCHTQVVEKVIERNYASIAYGARFSHKTHVDYVKGDCLTCHTITGGYGRDTPVPGTIRVREHLKERERSGKGCFSCHDGGVHYGRKVFSGEYEAGGTGGSCVKCHGDNLRVFPATG